ncbi:hypothetical protein HYT52_01495, partial [Candidatus Woesearchaeota archaeon]|nr:hypothetical protein [Candidatus Woesearchaeota archaeon]
HGSNIKIDASSLDTYYPKNIFSANGYDTLEFMFVYPSLPLYQPARLSLVVTSKDDEVLLSKNILGDVTNNPILKEQRWMHIETSIPLGMEAIKEIRIVSEPSGNEIKVKNIYLSKSGQSPLCTGDPSRADPITETATELETSSWIGEIDTFRYGELVNGREICNQLYDSSLAEGADPRNGKAWLGGTSVVSDSERMCCGDDFNEYYAGESESGGCWNSMVVQEGERIMNVQFDVVSAREEHTFAYNYVFPFEDFSIELEPVFTREFLAGRVNDCPVYPLTMFSRSNYFDECIEANLCLGPQIRDWCWYSTGEDLNEYLSGSGTTNCADGINLTQSFCPLGSQEDLECFGGCLLDRVTFDDGSLHSVTDLTRDQIDFDSLDYCTLPRLGGPATFAYQCPYYIFNTDRFNGKYEINLNSDLNLNDVSNTPVKIADINVDKKIFYGSDEKALRIINQLKPATSPILKTAFAYYPTGDVSESSISISSSDTEDEDISKELKAYSQDVRRLTLEQNSYVVSSVSSKINFYEEKNYACVADECYFPLPGGAIINTISAGLSLGDLSSEEMGIVRSKIDLPGDQTYLIRNPHPDLYELYFVKGDPNIPGNVIMITEDFQPFTEAGTLLVKRLSQQVVYHTETNEEDDLPISKFYGCQPADFIQDNLPPGFSASGFEEKTYCENIGPYFCSFGDSKDGSTTVNTWSEAVLPEVGYQELSEDITPEELSSFMHLRLAEESKGETTIQDRNVSARMTPGLNILPNANFVKSAGRDLYFWEFYEIDEGVVTTKIINELDSTETGIISTEMDDDTLETIKKITLPASTIMVSDKLSVLEGETYQLSHEGTCQDVKIDLYSSEGTGNPYVMVEDETGTATLGVISESGKTPSHLIVTFSGDASCTVLKPLLQILDGTSAPYNYNSQYDGKLYPRAATSCCPEDYCWNGYACVAPMTDSVMAEVPGNGNYYRCIEGQWYDLPRLSDWNGEEQGFCQTDSQCFVLSTNSEFIDENIVARPTTETDPETTINFHQQVDSVKFPNCINQDEFIMDHYCGQNNQWTSRTKFLANELLQYPGTSDFALYCTNPYDALEEFDNKEDPYIYGSAGSTEILTSPLGGDADEPSEETARRAGSCFQIPTSTDEDGGENDAQRLIPLKDNTCINSVCVLKHEDGKAVFSTTLNKPVDSDDSFLKALDLENTACDPESGATLSGSSTSGSVACVTSDPIGGELQHIPNLNAVIYGKEGIGRTFSFSYVTSKISEFFADFFGVETSLSTSLEFVETADNFRDLYILNHERKQVLAVKETLPKTEDVSVTRKALIADYEEFDTPICEFVQENRLSEGFEVKHLQGEKLDCIKDGNNQRVEVLVTAGNQEVLDQLWPQLTGKLRPQIGE